MTNIYEILGVATPVAIFAYSYIERFRIERYISTRFIQKTVKKWRKTLDEDEYSPTLIIGLGRGGSYVGSLLTNKYGHKPYAVIDLEHCWVGDKRRDFLRYDLKFKIETDPDLLDRVLIVSGEMNTSKSLEYCVRYMRNSGANHIRALTVYSRTHFSSTESNKIVGVPHYIERISGRDLRTPWGNTQDYIQGKTKGRKCDYIGKILLIRHCESVTNFSNDQFDDPVVDSPLTEKGVQQSEVLAKYLNDRFMIDKIYSSDFHRTKQSARPLSEILGIQISIDPSLSEVSFGKWAGKKFSDIERDFPEEYLAFRRDNWDSSPPGANFYDALEGGMKYLEKAGRELIENSYEVIATFTHMNLIQLITVKINDQDKNKYREVKVPNCSVTEVTVHLKDDGTFRFSLSQNSI